MNSGLMLYSLATVTEDKKWDSKVVKCTPIEHLTDIKGDVNASTKELGKVISRQVITATWWNITGNRSSSPDLRIGEDIILYRFADTDKFFWVNREQQLEYRRLEHVVNSYCGIEAPGEAPGEDDLYRTIISTRDGYIRIHTSKNKSNNEETYYDIVIDPKFGTLTISDDQDNKIELLSMERRMNITTSYVHLINDTLEVDGDTIIHKTLTVDGDTLLKSNLQTNGNTNCNGSTHSNGTVSSGTSFTAPGGYWHGH